MKRAILFLLVATMFAACTVTLPIAATSNPIGTKVGTSKATAVFGIWLKGDASIQTAARNGGITKISTVDLTRRRGIIFSSYKTTVTGE